MKGTTDMDIAIPLFDRFTALDAVGPYETLSRLPGAKVTFVAAQPGPIASSAVKRSYSGIAMSMVPPTRRLGLT